jgi:hypothetical protein
VLNVHASPLNSTGSLGCALQNLGCVVHHPRIGSVYDSLQIVWRVNYIAGGAFEMSLCTAQRAGIPDVIPACLHSGISVLRELGLDKLASKDLRSFHLLYKQICPHELLHVLYIRLGLEIREYGHRDPSR